MTALAKAETRVSELDSELRLTTATLTAEQTRLEAELRTKAEEWTTAGQTAVDAKNEVEVMRSVDVSK